jgi:hypothetical protein
MWGFTPGRRLAGADSTRLRDTRLLLLLTCAMLACARPCAALPLLTLAPGSSGGGARVARVLR